MNIMKSWLLLACLALLPYALPARAAAPKTDAELIPTLEELGSLWLDTRLISHMPSLHNFHDMAVCAPELFGVNYIPGGTLYSSMGPRWLRYNTLPVALLSLDDAFLAASNCRWFPHQAVRIRKVDMIEYEVTVRLVFEGRGIMYQLEMRNTGTRDKTPNLAVTFPYDETSVTPAGEPLVTYYDGPTGLWMGYAFIDKPGSIEPDDNNNVVHVRWKPKVPAGGRAVIRMVTAVEDSHIGATEEALRLRRAFTEFWNQARQRWTERWRQAFTPGNPHFSGSVPVLDTNNVKLRDVYYRSILTLLLLERTNLAQSSRVFVTSGERQRGTLYLWDTSLWSTVFALLEPRAMRDQLDRFLQCDPQGGGVYNMEAGRQGGDWSAFNAWSLFQLAWGYLGVTGDTDYLARPLGGRSVLERIDDLAGAWRRLLPAPGKAAPGEALADYGEPHNLLDCVSTYRHRVPALNAANAWMMRELAGLYERRGDAARAAALRQDAERVVRAVLALYEPGEGVWACLDREGKRVPVRHCIDFVTIGRLLREDLPSSVSAQMLEFARGELLLRNWMRAMSLEDPAAEESDRPDHGPLGAYDAWAALATATMGELGMWPRALAFMNQSQAVLYEGVYAQAHELFGENRFEPSAGVHIAMRGGMMRECSGGGAFAEMVLSTVFGYRPAPGAPLELFQPQVPRGIDGRLLHVRHGRDFYTITSGPKGLALEKEPLPRAK